MMSRFTPKKWISADPATPDLLKTRCARTYLPRLVQPFTPCAFGFSTNQFVQLQLENARPIYGLLLHQKSIQIGRRDCFTPVLLPWCRGRANCTMATNLVYYMLGIIFSFVFGIPVLRSVKRSRDQRFPGDW